MLLLQPNFSAREELKNKDDHVAGLLHQQKETHVPYEVSRAETGTASVSFKPRGATLVVMRTRQALSMLLFFLVLLRQRRWLELASLGILGLVCLQPRITDT